MKKIMSFILLDNIAVLLLDETPLDLNKLGDMNRNLPADADTKLCDGTPPTQFGVNTAILERLGLSEHFKTFNFDTMTYGPAVGFPYAIQAAKQLPGISEIIGEKTLMLHGGHPSMTDMADRACKSITGTNQIQIDTLEAIPMTSFPARLTIALEKLQSCTPEEQAQLTEFLNHGNSIVVTLNALFPAQTLPLRLSAEIIGSPEIAKQTIITAGYQGPVFEPVTQWLFTLQQTQGIRIAENIPTPNIETITSEFLSYFNAETGCSITHGLIGSGGGSGGLSDVARALDSKHTFILPPFFGPQKGILRGSRHNVTVLKKETTLKQLAKQLPSGSNILLTFPNNPDGTIPSLDDITELVQAAKVNGNTLILDTTYFNVIRTEARENFQAVMNLISKTEGLHWVSISSASKALALTKFRTEFITGDSETLRLIAPKLIPINSITAIALEEGLKVENRETFKEKLLRNVKENASYLHSIAMQIVPHEVIITLNSGLQKFDMIVKELKTLHPDEELTIDTGDGALYAKLIVPTALQSDFHRLAAEHKLALTPGEIFYVETYTESDNVLARPQDWYRLSLMSETRELPLKEASG